MNPVVAIYCLAALSIVSALFGGLFEVYLAAAILVAVFGLTVNAKHEVANPAETL